MDEVLHKYPDILTVVYVSSQTSVLKDAEEYDCSLPFYRFLICVFYDNAAVTFTIFVSATLDPIF